jgi:peptidoglycan/LPS O-acetylase OafA/YrhL
MIRFLLRFLGLVTLAAAFVFFVYDGARFIANQTIDFTTVRYVWESLHQNSLLLFQPAVERHVAPWLWQSLIQPYFLEQPVSLLFLIVGALLILLGRRKKPLIGYAR